VGVTVAIATHDLDLINALRRRTIVLNSGQIIKDVPGAAQAAH
jgi:ABC-type ATPase involved in cell division